MARRVFIVVEDTYAPHALRQVLRRRGFSLNSIVIVRLEVCSRKMERIVKAHIMQGSRVVVIADAEQEQPRHRERWIREKHGLGSSADIIIVAPCMEALACEALGLRGCREKPCSNGPLQAVNTYWRRRHGRDYDKRFLPNLLQEADTGNRLDQVPEFKKLIEILEDP